MVGWLGGRRVEISPWKRAYDEGVFEEVVCNVLVFEVDASVEAMKSKLLFEKPPIDLSDMTMHSLTASWVWNS